MQKIDSQGTANYVYDGSTLIAETDNLGTITTYYTPGGGGYVRPSGDRWAFYQEDGLGSTLGVVNNFGDRQTRYLYDGFGNVKTLLDNSYWSSAHKFVGKEGYYNDQDSGMLLLGHRYYLPTIGRFLTPDPIGHDGGLNLYAYCDNNPLTSTDPDGLDPNYDKNRANHLASKVEAHRHEVNKRVGELREDIHNLPETHVDDLKNPKLSRRGHRRMIEKHRELMYKYHQELEKLIGRKLPAPSAAKLMKHGGKALRALGKGLGPITAVPFFFWDWHDSGFQSAVEGALGVERFDETAFKQAMQSYMQKHPEYRRR